MRSLGVHSLGAQLSSLKPNSFSVIVRSTSGSRTPRCASSMTFSATNLVAGSSLPTFSCKTPQTGGGGACSKPIITLLCRLRARLRAFRRRYLCANPAWCFENSTDSTEEDHSIVQYWFPPPCGAPSQNLYSSPTPRFP